MIRLLRDIVCDIIGAVNDAYSDMDDSDSDGRGRTDIRPTTVTGPGLPSSERGKCTCTYVHAHGGTTHHRRYDCPTHGVDKGGAL